MRATEIPGVLAYLAEAKRALRSEMYLACILICGTISEMVLREIASDYESKISQVIDTLGKEGAIIDEHRSKFHNIRKIRNKYAHMDFKKNWGKPPEGIAFEREGVITFLEEALAEQPSMSDKIFLKHWAHSALDAQEIYRLASKTLLNV